MDTLILIRMLTCGLDGKIEAWKADQDCDTDFSFDSHPQFWTDFDDRARSTFGIPLSRL